jgi:hypothetical protein
MVFVGKSVSRMSRENQKKKKKKGMYVCILFSLPQLVQQSEQLDKTVDD